MTDPDFNELSGRIEGTARAVGLLIAMMEDKDMINGKQYCAMLRGSAKTLHIPGPSLSATKRTLRDLAKALDDARRHRRAKALKG